MYRHIRRGAVGFSLVELLVTIVIAAIAFAAIVPLFVSANQKNAADLFRQTALNTAQDRIEKIRALDYASITQANLGSTAFLESSPGKQDGPFGSTATIGTGGSLRTFSVVYGVDTTHASYKVVTLTVAWTAPPAPVKPVVVQTIIYRQYAGPTLASFYVTPFVSDAGVIDNSSTIITLSALPTRQWLGGSTASVQFIVYGIGGIAVDSKTVTYATDGSAGYGTTYGVTSGTFWWKWDSTGLADGIYSVSATGYSGSFFGPTERFYFKIQRGNELAAPQNLTASPGKTSVTLDWSAVAAPAGGYRIYRLNSGTDAWDLIGTVVGQATTTYTDSQPPLTANTSYQYRVCGLDSSLPPNEGLRATVTTRTTNSGVTFPTAPQTLTARGDYPGAGVIELTWYQPASWGSAGQDYLIEKSSDGTTGWTTVGSAVPYNASPFPATGPFVYDYSAGSGVTLYFRVTARAAGGVAGGVSSTVSASTLASTYRGSLTLTNTSPGNGQGNDVYVWVQMVSSAMYFNTSGDSFAAAQKPAGAHILAGLTAVFANLPNGGYNVWVSTTSSYSDAGQSPQTSATISNAPAFANVHR